MTRRHVPTPEELEQGLVPDAPERRSRHVGGPGEKHRPDEPAVHQMSIVVPSGVGERVPSPTSPSSGVTVEPAGSAARETPNVDAIAVAREAPVQSIIPDVVGSRVRGRRIQVAEGAPVPASELAQPIRLTKEQVTVLITLAGAQLDLVTAASSLLPLARSGRESAQRRCLQLGAAAGGVAAACISWASRVQGWTVLHDSSPLEQAGFPPTLLPLAGYVEALPPKPTRLAAWLATKEERAEYRRAQQALGSLCEMYPGLRAFLDAESADPAGHAMVRAVQGLPGRYDDPALVAARPYRRTIADLRLVIGDPPLVGPTPLPQTGDSALDRLVAEVFGCIPELAWPLTSSAAAENALASAVTTAAPRAGPQLVELLRELDVAALRTPLPGIDPKDELQAPSAPPRAAEAGGAPGGETIAEKRREAALKAAATRARRREERLADEARAEAERARRTEARREAARRGAATRAAAAAQQAEEEERRRLARQDAARRAAATRAANKAEQQGLQASPPAAAAHTCRACRRVLVLRQDLIAGVHDSCSWSAGPSAEPRRGLFPRAARSSVQAGRAAVTRQDHSQDTAAPRAAGKAQEQGLQASPSAAGVHTCPTCGVPLVSRRDVVAGVHDVCTSAAQEPPEPRRGLLARLRRRASRP